MLRMLICTKTYYVLEFITVLGPIKLAQGTEGEILKYLELSTIYKMEADESR